MAGTDPAPSPSSAEHDPAWHGIDPTLRDSRRVEDPFPALHHLRRVAPVNETPLGFFRLSRYADCVRLLRDVPCGVRRSDGTPTGLSMGGRPEGGQFMLQQDPPAHTRLRKLVARSFTPRATERWRPRVREIVGELLAPALAAGGMDVVGDFALPLPSTLICEMLGVPASDRVRFTLWTARVTHLLAGDLLAPDERTRAEAAAGELATYFDALIRERRAALRDDLLSRLIRAEEEGDRLSPDELLVQSMGLLVAGFETTVGLIALGVKNRPSLFRVPARLDVALAAS